MSTNGINFGKKSQIDFSSFGAGLKREDLKTDAQKSIFNSIDTDKNGVLDKTELEAFQKNLDENGDGSVEKKEVDNYFKKMSSFFNPNGGKVDKKQNQAEMLKFLQEYGANTENITSSETTETNGVKTVTVKYKDNTTESVAVDSNTGKVTTTKTDADGVAESEVKTSDGTLVSSSFKSEERSATIEYAADGKTPVKMTEIVGNQTSVTEFGPDGKTPEKTVITDTTDNSTATITYDDSGKQVSMDTKKGIVSQHFEYNEDGQPVLKSQIENEGIPAKEKKSEFTYNESGTITQTITESGKTTVRTLSSGGVPMSEEIQEDGKPAIHRQYYEKGYLDKTTDANGNEVQNLYSSEGEPLAQTKTVNGKEYSVEYDGDGTKVIVQNNEAPAAIAQKFGCSVQDLIAANKDKVHGKAPNQYFLVGEEVTVPGKHLEADDKNLKTRGSAVEEQQQYAEAMARKAQREAQRQAEEAQYRALGMTSSEGRGGKITGKYKGGETETFTIIGRCGRERTLAKSSSGKLVTISNSGIILKDEYVAKTNLYDSGQKVNATIKIKHKDGSVTTETRKYVVVGELGKGRKAVIDDKGKTYVMSHDGKILDENYVAKDAYADSITQDSKIARETTVSLLEAGLNKAETAFNAQMDKDGWAADVADGVSNLWGWAQEDGNQAWRVRDDMKKYRQDLNQLKAAAKQGDGAFRAKFKQLYGVEFNQQAVAEYYRHPTDANYKKAFGSNKNIASRVAKYNQSQDDGAVVVKTTVKVGAAVAVGACTGGAGLVGGMLITGGATFAAGTLVDVSDRTSSHNGLQDGELGSIVRENAVDGTIASLTFGVVKGGPMFSGAGKVVNGYNSAANSIGSGVTRITGSQTAGRLTSSTINTLGEQASETIIDQSISYGADAMGFHGSNVLLAEDVTANSVDKFANWMRKAAT